MFSLPGDAAHNLTFSFRLFESSDAAPEFHSRGALPFIQANAGKDRSEGTKKPTEASIGALGRPIDFRSTCVSRAALRSVAGRNLHATPERSTPFDAFFRLFRPAPETAPPRRPPRALRTARRGHPRRRGSNAGRLRQW